MRIALYILLLLAALLTLICITCYFGAGAQEIETGAELRASRSTEQPISERDIAIHVSRLERQERNWGITSLFSVAIAAVTASAIVRIERRTRDS